MTEDEAASNQTVDVADPESSVTEYPVIVQLVLEDDNPYSEILIDYWVPMR